MWEILYHACYGLTALTGVSLGIFVLWKNPRSRINVTWALMSFAVAIWASWDGIYFFQEGHGRAILSARIANYAAVFIPIFFTHFCLALIERPARSNVPLITSYAFAIAMAGFFLTPWFVRSVSPKLIFRNYVNPGPLFVVFTIEFFVLAIYSHALLLKHLVGQTKERQNQIKWVLVATITGYLCGSTTFFLVYDVPFNPYPSLLTFLYTAIISYAIVKHRLMDIRVVISRGLVYSVLIGGITATYLVAVLIVEWGFKGFFGYRSLIATVVVAFLIAIFFNPIRNWIQTRVDRALFKATPTELADQREQLLVQVGKGEQMKAVATLAAGLAHEIKNPLASIKTFTQYLDTNYTDPEFRAKFKRIVGGEIERINLIVQQLLEFAKPQPPKLTPVSVTQLLDETLEFMNNDFMRQQVNVRRSYAGQGQILGDPQRLKQVFLNLLLNSLQAMNGHGELDVSTTVHGAELRVEIQDNGVGMSPESLARMFEPFFTTKPTGTGLGLCVVQGIIRDHGGRISCDSRPGFGTTMSLVLPLATPSLPTTMS